MKDDRHVEIGAALVRQVIEAAGLEVAVGTSEAQRLEACLAEIIRWTIKKAPRKRMLTPREMSRVMTMHARFDRLLKSLQDRGHPPPLLPRLKLESGEELDPWAQWEKINLKFEDDTQERLNWSTIGELIAVYEALFATKIAKSSPDAGSSRPIRFIDAALRAVRERVTLKQYDVDRMYYVTPDLTPSFPPAGIRAGRLFCASAQLKQWAA